MGYTGGGSLTDASGTITTGGTSQQVLAANPSRRYLLVQNLSTTDLWLRFAVAAVTDQPSIRLVAGATFEWNAPGFVPEDSFNVIGGTTGQKFVVKEA